MYERTTTQGTPSIPTWETLHVWLRGVNADLKLTHLAPVGN